MQGKTLHLVQRLRGGGFAPVPDQSQFQMGIAAGGFIKQCILEDRYPADRWNHEGTVHINVQILNSQVFRSVTGLAPPMSPISAKTYADLGLPFYKIWEEKSTIEGGLLGVKSVKTINNTKRAKGKNDSSGSAKAKEGDGEEKVATNQPLVLLEPDGTPIRFRPVSELENELATTRVMQF